LGAAPSIERRTLAGLFFSSLLLGFSGALMPGPVFAAVVAGSASAGFWYGPAVVLGHGVLELITVAALARGAGRVLSRPRVTRAIAAVGGVTLLWLGIGMVLDGLAQRVVVDLSGAAPVDATPVVLGVVLSATNPYWVLWWATAGATYVALSLRSGAAGLGAFYTGHILSDLVWYAFIAGVVASGTRLLGPAIQGPYNVLVALAGAFLIFMALYFLRTAWRGPSRA
jgi:threonine/homoserine/homoserine lactone efflux protein